MNLIGLGLVGFSAILLLILALLQRQSAPVLRPIPALRRFHRAVGLSVEEGTRLFLSLGRSSLLTPRGGAPLAGLAVLRHLAERTSLGDRPPLAVAGEPALALLAQEALKAGYQAAGALELYQPTSGRLTGMTPFSAAAGTLPVLRDEMVSAGLLLGDFGAEAALLAEAAERENALLIGASPDPAAQAALYAATQEALIGEELFAASAYLDRAPLPVASLITQDILRWLIILLILAGSALKLLGLI